MRLRPGQIIESKDKRLKLIVVIREECPHKNNRCRSDLDCKQCDHFEYNIYCKGCTFSKMENCYEYIKETFGIDLEPACEGILGDSVFRLLKGGL